MDAAVLTIGGAPLRVDVLTVGATLIGVWCPDAAGEVANVVLRLDDLDAYRDPVRNPYLGSTVGRFANRIAGARFTLDGVEHPLTANEGTTCLHGGADGWSFRDWDVVDHLDDRVVLRLVSPDGDQGFPGEVTATVTYRVDGWTVHVEAEATTTAASPISMTNHAYWNLAGSGTIDRHWITVQAERVVDVDAQLLPTGTTSPVVGTDLDLRGGVRVGRRGLDHCWWPALGGWRAGLAHRSGRSFTLRTDQPSIQVYTADGLGAPFGARAGVCFEPQQLPDAPNQPGFPSAILRPGDTYRSRTTYEFSSTVAPGAG